MMEPKPEFLPLGDDFPEPHMEPVEVSEADWLAQEIDGERYGDVAADRDRLAAEVEALRADAERLNSGCILTQERDDFGEQYQRITTGIDLRAAIDAAKAKEDK